MTSNIRQHGVAITLSDMLLLEDCSEVLDICCPITNIPLWPQIRVQFFRMILSDLIYANNNITGKSSAHVAPSRALITLGKSIIHNVKEFKSSNIKSEICLMTDSVANQFVDGKWKNRLGDYFALAAPSKTIAIEDHSEWKWQFPRHNPRVLFHSPIQASNSIYGRLFRKEYHYRIARELVLCVRNRGVSELGWDMGDVREAYLIDVLSKKAAALPHQYRMYIRLLHKIRPKLILVGAGCYGSLSALFAAAKDLGITTAEYQHGAISTGHDAYNFAPNIINSEVYKKILPEFFLGYGDWWNQQINAPLKKITIGNPHRDYELGKLSTGSVTQDMILILSDGIEFNKYLEFAIELVSLVTKSELRICIRPHPSERTFINVNYGSSYNGVFIDQNVDLYASLRMSQAVLSELSTGLFEAVGIVKKIFIWDTTKARFTYPNLPFQAVGSPKMLIDLLENSDESELASDVVESIWASNWQVNYRSFLNNCGIVTTG